MQIYLIMVGQLFLIIESLALKNVYVFKRKQYYFRKTFIRNSSDKTMQIMLINPFLTFFPHNNPYI